MTGSVAAAAVRIENESLERLPLVDALIAGCAKTENATLVHRDTHMALILSELLLQINLLGS